MIAQDHLHFADIVMQCIEAHIRRVPPWAKLPAFYLLDAISKNVYDPYARHFSTIVVRLFIDTYEQVDHSTRSKMIEMLTTWRTGAPSGKELFGTVNQIAIERHVWPEGGAEDAESSILVTAPQVLDELEIVLGQKRRVRQSDPYDQTTSHQIDTLVKLRDLIQRGAVSQAELGSIVKQLRSLAAPTSSRPPSQEMSLAPTLPAPVPASHGHQAFLPGPSNPYAAPPPPQPQYAYPPAYSQQSTFQQPKIEPSASSSVPPAAAPVVPDVTSIFNALLKAGIVTGSSSNTPTGAGATAKAETPPPITTVDDPKENDRKYRRAIRAVGVKLNSTDLNKHRTQLPSFLYDQLPGQCKQCGIRFADTPSAKKKLQDHLDMHFQVNRKASQAVGRGHSRDWYIGVEDWTHDINIDVKGKGRADAPHSMKAAAAADAAKVEAELRALYVVVPPGDEAKPISCPICKEPFKSEFNEDDEEWIWRNAVRKDDKIYHAVCHAEASASKSTLAVRLRGEVASRSRSRTPEASRSTPPKLDSPSPTRGIKRKAEDDATVALHAEQSTPPTKKLAISPI
ncbi:hypothetical protein EIP91_011384 [Steccherinum ochraceum]|uniref:CID domain-containing protein n=1 Tax=Steccherinum ochraceum TaxID=92696 RepID=A0A4R0RM14_9APHY|nr:hypothetical protein EIP91_011384 [Steccherinum ochraceum]